MSLHYFPSHNSISHKSYITPDLSLISLFRLKFLFSGLVNAYNKCIWLCTQRRDTAFSVHVKCCLHVCATVYQKWQKKKKKKLLCISPYIKVAILIKDN